MPPPTLREQAELGALRVLDEYQRTGVLPRPVLRRMQAHAWANGRALTAEQVEREARDWFERVLAVDDAGGDVDEVE